jgi:uncharacterized protein YjbI with pentapeptide repeats
MLFDHQTITDATQLLNSSEEAVFRYSAFEDFSFEGGHTDAAFLFCTFTRLKAYWGHFNLGVFLECRFEDCTFRGTAFSGCRFVECSFLRCHFVKDNLGGECSFEDTKWYGCTQSNSEGLGVVVPLAL